MMKQLRYAILLLLASFILPSCEREAEQVVSKDADTYSNEVALKWFKLFQDIDRVTPGYRPPAAARMVAYTGLAGYEAAVNGMPQNKSLGAHFTGLQLPQIEENVEYHWPTAVNAAYAQMFLNFYPHVSANILTRIINQRQEFENQFHTNIKNEVFDRSSNYGKAIATAVFEWSKTDTYGHEAYKNPRPTNYVPPAVGANGEKLWQPTFPDYTRALFPYWGNVRTFAMRQNELVGKQPIPWSENPTSKFYQQALEVKLAVEQSTYDDKWIAEFWSDDIFQLTFEPAGRMVAIGNQLVELQNIKLDKAVLFYAQIGMALNDSAVSVWKTKYTYNVERPTQYIRRIMSPNWVPLLNNYVSGVSGVTPEFPAYPSGHSGFAASGGAILAHTFGSMTFTDRCHEGRTEFLGMPRTFNNFAELAAENAYSRIPLGVHFRMDCDEGIRLGYLAALRVVELPWN